MAETTIEWTTTRAPNGTVHRGFTFNPVHGCFEVSPACDHCYAREFSKVFGDGVNHWGVDAPLREFGDKHWNDPLRWNRRAWKLGVRLKVFCASMADVFDNRWPVATRARLFRLIMATPNLDWLLLTKRIGNVKRLVADVELFARNRDDYPLREFCASWLDDDKDESDTPPANVWVGATVVTQEEADRDVPKLLSTPAAIRFLSCEPLLENIDLGSFTFHASVMWNDRPGIDWVIAGGESGAKARPAAAAWARSLRDQCKATAVPYLWKQWGEFGEDGRRVGKDAAGNMLDGRQHLDFPVTAAPLVEPPKAAA